MVAGEEAFSVSCIDITQSGLTVLSHTQTQTQRPCWLQNPTSCMCEMTENPVLILPFISYLHHDHSTTEYWLVLVRQVFWVVAVGIAVCDPSGTYPHIHHPSIHLFLLLLFFLIYYFFSKNYQGSLLFQQDRNWKQPVHIYLYEYDISFPFCLSYFISK